VICGLTLAGGYKRSMPNQVVGTWGDVTGGTRREGGEVDERTAGEANERKKKNKEGAGESVVRWRGAVWASGRSAEVNDICIAATQTRPVGEIP
jgi:hypothetical protein